MNNRPFVTVVVPMRNETSSIGLCIQALKSQDYPLDSIEVICVDGASDDGTSSVARSALARPPQFANSRVLENPQASTPSNLNHGLAAASGHILCRVDARSVVPPHYVRTCVDILEQRPEIAVVGGRQRAVPVDGNPIEIGIARALNNRFTTGFARYRSRRSSGAADTVYLGAFRTKDLRSVGGWDERFSSNQDYELNRRMSKIGEVWFESALVVNYLPRRTFTELFRQYMRFGVWKVTYWRTTGDPPRPRQLLLLLLPSLIATGTVLLTIIAPRMLPLMVMIALALAVAIEGSGTDGPPSGVRGRLAGVVAVVTIGAGWIYGIARQYFYRLKNRASNVNTVSLE